MSDYREGFRDGYEAGRASVERFSGERILSMQTLGSEPKKMKRPASPKMKLLTKMTATKWAKYSKGSGKKTYVQIRAEVSRSMAYKKKCKGMK